MTTSQTKRCSKCGKPKDIDADFYKRPNGSPEAECKKCHCFRRSEYKRKNPIKRYVWDQNYYNKKKEALNAKSRAFKKMCRENKRCPGCGCDLTEEDVQEKYIKCQNCREGIHKPLRPIFAKHTREIFLNENAICNSSK